MKINFFYKLRSALPILIIFLFYFPIFIMLILGFNKNILINKFHFGFIGFSQLFINQPFLESIYVTIVIGIISSIFTVIFAFFICISVSNSWKRIKNPTLKVLKIPLLNTDICNAILATFLFIFVNIKFGLITFISAHIILTLPYAIFIIYPQTLTIKNEYLDSAKDLGANWFIIIKKVYYPILFKILIIAFFICFAISIDDFIFSFFNSGSFQNVSQIIYTTKYIKPYIYSFGTIMLIIIMLIFGLYLLVNKIIKIKKSSQLIENNYLGKKIRNNQENISFKTENINKKLFSIILRKNVRVIILCSTIIILVFSLLYLFLIESTSLKIYLFNGYVSGKSINDFSDKTKIKTTLSNYSTNEEFFAKTKYTNFDIGMLSDYAINNKINNLEYLTQDDKNEFLRYYNLYSNTHISSYIDIFKDNKYSAQLYNLYSNYKINQNSIFDYFFPYACGDIKFLFNNNNLQNINSKPYLKIYNDSLQGKNIVLFDDPRDLLYLGIMIGINSGNHDIKIVDNKPTFSKQNLLIAKNYLSKMLKNKNTVLQTDTTPIGFNDGKIDDAFTNGYDYAEWFSNVKNTGEYSFYNTTGYQDSKNINNINVTSNIWDDGFVLNKKMSNSKKKKAIQFIAFQYSNDINKYNCDFNQFYTPSAYISNYIKNNPDYIYQNKDKTKINLLIPTINPATQNYDNYYLFTDENENLVQLYYSEVFSNQ